MALVCHYVHPRSGLHVWFCESLSCRASRKQSLVGAVGPFLGNPVVRLISLTRQRAQSQHSGSYKWKRHTQRAHNLTLVDI